MLGFAGTPDAANRAIAIFDFEKAIAQVHWTRIDSRDADKRYNKLTFADIEAMAPGFHSSRNRFGPDPQITIPASDFAKILHK